jgi:hypothetical protein
VKSAPQDALAVVALQVENVQAEAVVRAGEAELYGAFEYDDGSGRLPRDRAESYFQLVRCREALIELAQAEQVPLQPAEAFGFASYAESAPEAELIGPVHRQRRAIERVMRLLLPVRPDAIVAVQRERPPIADLRSEATGLRSELKAGAAADFFRRDPIWRVATGGPRGEGVRVVFEGETAHLREFLHRLAEQRPPLLALSVEVEPGANVTSPASIDNMPPTLPPIVPTQARFAVVIEVVDTDVPRSDRTATHLTPPAR